MAEEIEDVKETPSTPPEEGKVVETPPETGDDKEKNFAELRRKAEEATRENEELRKKLAEKETSDRSLSVEDEVVEEKTTKKETPDTLKIIFDRDMKEATHQWNEKNKVSSEEWNQIKSKVSLKGTETVSEIRNKIDEAYNSIPSVRERKDKELIERGRKEAMQQFSDDELDIGSGGDVDLGGGVAPRLNQKTDKWRKGLGLSDKELKEVDMESDTNQWSDGKTASRKFFQG